MKKNEFYFFLLSTLFVGAVVTSLLLGYNFGRYMKLDEINTQELAGKNAFNLAIPQVIDYNVVFDRYISGEFVGLTNSNSNKKYYTISFEDENFCLSYNYGYGLSMFPAMSQNSVVIYDKCYPPEKIKVGDLVIADKTLHRVVSISLKDKTITTKGDASITQNNPVPFSELKGKVIALFNIYSNSQDGGGVRNFTETTFDP